MSEPPHAPRNCWLRNGNPPGDLSLAPRCGARTRAGTSCCNPQMSNGRCRMHGGRSTGPRTAEGRKKCQLAPLKHGQRSAAVVAEGRALTAQVRALKLSNLALCKEVATFLMSRRQGG